MGERAFNQIQYGLESSAAHGTQVAATRRSLGTIAIPADRKPTFPEDTLALRARSAFKPASVARRRSLTACWDETAANAAADLKRTRRDPPKAVSAAAETTRRRENTCDSL